MGTHLENRIRINGLDSLRSRPGVRFAPSGLRTVLDERSFVARMEPAGRANARPVGAIRGARIDGGCIQTQRATEGIEKTRVLAAQVLVICVLMLASRGG